jgi:competence protein ComEA
VDQSSPPWRVFDSPGPAVAATTAATEAGGSRIAGTNPVVAIAGVGAALVVGALAVVIALSGAGAGAIVGPETGLVAVASDAAGAAGEIVVDVAGAVVDPGVYRLPPGSRVGDAIDAAGGFSPRVDAGRVSSELNLAATLQDGAQVRIPSRDETPPPAGAGGSGGSGSGGGLINLNTASQSELESLPGIGPVTAEKIIASRATAPFRSIEELRERNLVYESTFEDIRALVTVG